MSLPEILIAITILSVALLGLAGVATTAIAGVRDSRQRQVATNMASLALEEARALAFDELFMPVAGETFDPDGSGPLCPEETPPVGAGSSVFDAPPYLTTSDGVTVTTTVTQARDANLSSGTGTPDCTNTDLAETRRLTVVATWSYGQTTHQVRQSTLVAESDRGLPKSKFDLDPPSVSRAAQSLESCFDFALTNLAGADRYSVKLPTTDAASAGYSVVAKIKDGVSPGNDLTLVDEGDSDADPDTPDPLNTNDSLPLRFCYTPTSLTPGTGTFQVEVRSLFDESVRRAVITEITPALAAFRSLYLHHSTALGPSQDQTRASTSELKINYTMDENAPTYSGALRNFDTSTDPDGRAGLWLRPNATTETDNDVRWDFQQPTGPSESYAGTAELTLWTWHSDQALVLPSEMVVSLLKVHKNGTTVLETVIPQTTVTYAHDLLDGWQPETFAFTLPLGGVTLDQEQYLRLRVRCKTGADTANERNCHLLYDHTAHQSVFELPWL